jgi:hypothetical protein
MNKKATMIWTSNKNARKWTATENPKMGNKWNTMEGKTQRRINEWNNTRYE